MRPVATEMNLSHGSAWMPRVVPAFSLKEMLFCTGWKSGRPRATIFSRCQFSLNQPRLSPWTGSVSRRTPGMGVSAIVRSLATELLALCGVGGFDGFLVGTPPVLVAAVPVDG